MSDVYLDKLSSDTASWLSVRQALIASNVANANTPGFKARDVKEMSTSGPQFADLFRTHDSHMTVGSGTSLGIATKEDTPWEVNHSGGSVSLAKEMIKAGEVASDFQLNTAVKKSFHRMMISVFGS